MLFPNMKESKNLTSTLKFFEMANCWKATYTGIGKLFRHSFGELEMALQISKSTVRTFYLGQIMEIGSEFHYSFLV